MKEFCLLTKISTLFIQVCIECTHSCSKANFPRGICIRTPFDCTQFVHTPSFPNGLLVNGFPKLFLDFSKQELAFLSLTGMDEIIEI